MLVVDPVIFAALVLWWAKLPASHQVEDEI
jgi:hypothetical protein